MFHLITLILLGISAGEEWTANFEERACYKCLRYEYDKANFTSLMSINENEAIIGAMNTVYKMDFQDQRVATYTDSVPLGGNSAYQNCIDTGRSVSDCQNYYKVMVQITETDVMLCGTNSFQPVCDIRRVTDLSFMSRAHVLSGERVCPSDPKTATAVIVLQSDAEVGFSATCTDECTDYQISRISLLPGSLSSHGKTMKTTDWLNSPTFIYSFEEGEYVYFLFYETAIEVKTEQVYSRIARICKNDIGSGQELYSNYFLSFMKARIYCTSNKPGQTPFTHDELGGAYYLDGVLYAVFSGQRNLKTGSILCSFTIATIDNAFRGPYLTFDSVERKYVSAENTPFSCSKKRSIPDATKKIMMERAISQSQPLYYTSNEDRLTSVMAVKKRVQEEQYTIIYTGSEGGYLVKVGQGLSTSTIHSSNVAAGPSGTILSLTMNSDKTVLYALSESWVTRVPIEQQDACLHATTCSECLDLYYPYCNWCKTSNEMRCVALTTECPMTDLVRPTETCRALPTFSKEPGDVVIRKGRKAVLSCGGRDGEVGVWQREDGAPISRSARHTKTSLIIPSVQLTDMGVYLCVLNNTSGKVSVKGYLEVTESPYFIMQPENISAFEEDINIELQCQASGSPKPYIKWFKKGGQVPDGSELTFDGFLKIYRVLKEDEGYYWCEAENEVDIIVSREAYLTISEGMMEKTEEQGDGDSVPTMTLVGMIIAIVVSAFLCFLVGMIAHKLYRRHRKKADGTISQTPAGPAMARGQWTPVNTLPYQIYRPQEWGADRMYPNYHNQTTLNAPPLPLRPDLMAQMARLDSVYLEEDEAPPAYDDRHTDSPPLLPPTPVSLQGPPVCFNRYTPPQFNTCPSGPHYASVGGDYAVITAPAPTQRQYSMDLRAFTAHPPSTNSDNTGSVGPNHSVI